MKTFESLEIIGIKQSGYEKKYLSDDELRFQIRLSFDIMTSNMFGLSLASIGPVHTVDRERTDAISSNSNVIILYYRETALSKATLYHTDDNAIEMAIYEYPQMPIPIQHWLLNPWSAIRQAKENRKHAKLPNLGVEGLVACVKALHMLIGSPDDLPLASILPSLELDNVKVVTVVVTIS